jgi:hypothetical protein
MRTRPAAFDAYLRAEKTLWGGYSPKVIETAVAGYTEALRGSHACQNWRNRRRNVGSHVRCHLRPMGEYRQSTRVLDAALRLRDPDLVRLKTEPLLDPLGKEPRFQAIERELKFPT